MAHCIPELEDNQLNLAVVVAVHSHMLVAVGDSQDEEAWSGKVDVVQEDKGRGLRGREPEEDMDKGIGDIHRHGRGERGEGACGTRKGEEHWEEDHHCQIH